MGCRLKGILSVSGQLSCSLSSSPIVGELTIAGNVPAYQGDYVVTPRPFDDQVLECKGLMMAENVLVSRVPYWETSNQQDGLTVFIADEA